MDAEQPSGAWRPISVGDERHPRRRPGRRSGCSRGGCISSAQACADAAGVPAELRRLAGEAVAGHRRQHQVERVLGAAAVRGRVGERADGLEQLDDRAGPAVGHDQRQRVLVRRPHVDEVDLDPVDLGRELRQRVQPRLARCASRTRSPSSARAPASSPAARPATDRRRAPSSASASLRCGGAGHRAAPPEPRGERADLSGGCDGAVMYDLPCRFVRTDCAFGAFLRGLCLGLDHVPQHDLPRRPNEGGADRRPAGERRDRARDARAVRRTALRAPDPRWRRVAGRRRAFATAPAGAAVRTAPRRSRVSQDDEEQG